MTNKVYYVEVDGEITEDVVRGFEEGIDYGEDKLSAPGRLEIITPSSAHVTIHEGKFHQIKRMFLVYGLKVTYLKRIAMGNLTLGDDLALGEYRKIKREDIIAHTQF